jgi:integrase/recombinase XerD
MLTLYRRHLKECPHDDRRYRRCKCPIWVQGSLAGEKIRKSLDLTSWEAATDLINDWASSGGIGVVKVEIPTISEAVSRFMEDAKARHLREATIKKLRSVLEKQLLPWCEKNGYSRLKQLDVDALREFRASWKDSPVSALKKLERLRSFFRFCVQSGGIKANPVLGIKPPKVHQAPTLPFTAEEFQKILDGCEKFANLGRYRAKNRTRVRALVLLMRHSGLRIGDAVTLTRDRIKDGRLFLYTAKTGTHVHLPLPKDVTALLDEVDHHREYFFWNGEGKITSAVGVWERTLKRLFEISKVQNGHSHRFRDTAAVEWLLSGIPIQDVSILLGHSSVKITEKHYSPWVKARQDRLEQLVRASWG